MVSRARRAAALSCGLVCIAPFAWGCGKPAQRASPQDLVATEVRRTPPSSVIAEQELADLEWGGDSTILAAVERGTSIVLVRWDGSLHRQVARAGDGPGEVRNVFGLARSPDRLVALDAHRFRVLSWTHEGELVRDAAFTPALATGVWMTDRGLALKSDGAFMSGAVHFDILESRGDSARRLSRFTTRNALRSADSTCSYCPSAVSRDGLVASSTSDTSYRILRWRTGGASLQSIERPDLPAIRRSQREADSVVQVFEEAIQRLAARGRATPENVARFRDAGRQNAVKRRFLARGLVFDEDGRLWVQRQVADGDSAAVDVFDRRARLIGSVRLPVGTIMHRAGDAHVLASSTDDEGVLTVIEYRVPMPRR